ncbi:MAG: kelch repeat-containing protein, partial [SAR202 cluster bacterium]|nr:kelch repeat-containing protein [SAR202 cluster bacterium]
PGHARSELQPSWSPDGKFIVELMKWPADSNDYEVVKINLETKEITPLTVNSFGEAQPHWGPVAQREGIWRQVSPFGSPPTPVAGASDAFDPATRTWHIFGGHTGSSETGQFWRYDAENNRWDSIIPFGPTPSSRTRGAIVWDDSNNRMLMYGGAPCSGAGTCKKDLWAYTPSDSAWTQLASAPVGRAGAASAWDAKRNRMMVFGGGDGDGTANTLMAYESDADSWTTLTSGPTPRGSYEPNGAVWDTANDRMLLFAGGGVEKLLNELWAYDPNTDQWSQLGPSGSWPPVRAAHSALWDSNTDRMLVFGGNGGSVLGDHNDVWAYSTADNEWVQLVQDQPLPPERRSHVAAWDSKVRRLLIWSGGNPRLSDFWVLQFNGGPE